MPGEADGEEDTADGQGQLRLFLCDHDGLARRCHVAHQRMPVSKLCIRHGFGVPVRTHD
jgi:hypothetical protein